MRNYRLKPKNLTMIVWLFVNCILILKLNFYTTLQYEKYVFGYTSVLNNFLINIKSFLFRKFFCQNFKNGFR